MNKTIYYASRRSSYSTRLFSQLVNDATVTSHVLISVCIAHHERGPLLKQALTSVREQTLPPSAIEAIVVDDGSESQLALETLKSISHWPEFRAGRWQLLRRTSQYLGAARNEAIRHAGGDYIYFLDDDNVLARASMNLNAAQTLLA